jgi:hypothetical protein
VTPSAARTGHEPSPVSRRVGIGEPGGFEAGKHEMSVSIRKHKMTNRNNS